MVSAHRAASANDAQSVFVFDTNRLGRRAGSMVHEQRTVVSDQRIGLDLEAIEPGTDVNLDLRFESVSEGVLVTGTAEADTTGQCSRCLEPITGHVAVHITELFAYPDSVTEATTEEEDVHRIVDHQIDLTQVLVDAVGLELPLSPVCSEECLGLCPDCGIPLNTAPAEHGHDKIDPRWAGLMGKVADGKE